MVGLAKHPGRHCVEAAAALHQLAEQAEPAVRDGEEPFTRIEFVRLLGAQPAATRARMCEEFLRLTASDSRSYDCSTNRRTFSVGLPHAERGIAAPSRGSGVTSSIDAVSVLPRA